MLASYATVARRAAAVTAIAAAIMVGLSAALVGVKGLVGALIAVAIVVVFFGISIVVVGRAAKVSPAAMMIAALATAIESPQIPPEARTRIQRFLELHRAASAAMAAARPDLLARAALGAERAALAELFPRGVDLLFVYGDALAAVPRSARVKF